MDLNVPPLMPYRLLVSSLASIVYLILTSILIYRYRKTKNKDRLTAALFTFFYGGLRFFFETGIILVFSMSGFEISEQLSISLHTIFVRAEFLSGTLSLIFLTQLAISLMNVNKIWFKVAVAAFLVMIPVTLFSPLNVYEDGTRLISFNVMIALLLFGIPLMIAMVIKGYRLAYNFAKENIKDISSKLKLFTTGILLILVGDGFVQIPMQLGLGEYFILIDHILVLIGFVFISYSLRRSKSEVKALK